MCCATRCVGTTAAPVRSPRELNEQIKPILEESAHQKVTPDRLFCARTEALAQCRISEKLHDPFGGLIDRLNQKAVVAVLDLPFDAANIAANDSGSLPHCFCNREAEPLTR